MGRSKLEHKQSEKFYNYIIKIYYKIEDNYIYNYLFEIKILNESYNLNEIRKYLDMKYNLFKHYITNRDYCNEYGQLIELTEKLIKYIDNILKIEGEK
jgi:hypothetical protein